VATMDEVFLIEKTREALEYLEERRLEFLMMSVNTGKKFILRVEI
jgi:hypothetical protein